MEVGDNGYWLSGMEVGSDGEPVEPARSGNDSPSESRRKGGDKKRKSHRRERRRRSSSSSGHSREGRKHKKKRHRRRSSSKSRSRSRSRSPSRSRDRDRKRRHKKRSRRSRSRSRSSWSEDSWEGGTRSDHKLESYKYQQPNNTVMVRGMADHITENDIRQDLLRSGLLVKDIRLIRNRDTGASRGFAFTEFHTVADAKKWMDAKKGLLVFADGSESNLIYSVSKGSGNPLDLVSSDWYCGKCMAYNFKRRDICYKCNEPKPPVDADSEFLCESSNSPTTTIMLFELDTLTTEDGVLQAFQDHPQLASMPIRSVRVPREPETSLSRRICYVESNTVADSIRLFAVFAEAKLEIDGVVVQAVYHKAPTAVGNNTAAAAALAAAQWTNNSGVPPPPDENDTEKMAEYSAKLYAKNETEYASYLTYYRDYYTKKAQAEQATQGMPSTCSAEVSSGVSAINNYEAVSGPQKLGRTDTASTSISKKVPVPDSSKFQYDEASGYYCDPVSGYYYDPTNQSYYDSHTQQFLYWDANKQNYTVAGENSNAIGESSHGSTDKPSGNKKFPRVKEKVVKTVAKEMEKWAKHFNVKKEPSSSYPKEVESFARWNRDVGNDPGMSRPPDSTNLPFEPKPIAEAEGDSSSNDADLLKQSGTVDPSDTFIPSDTQFLDKQKIACLLCKRQFSTVDVLMKHAKMSDLHKQNLAEVLGVPSGSSGPNSKGYRDRAKERRMKFGSENDTAASSLKDVYRRAREDAVTSYVEEPTKQGITEDNIGNKLLQKMGWQAGQGLGRDNKGITDPIKADRRVGKFGLGMEVPVGFEIDDSDDRQTKARKLTMARYMRLE